MSVATDTLAVERPQELTKYWKEEFERLYEDVMSVPGGQLPCHVGFGYFSLFIILNCYFW